MCGIFGYIGSNTSIRHTLEGLQRMEYRGYDSAGLVFEEDNAFTVIKTVGKVEELVALVSEYQFQNKNTKALGHTRWATHGVPSTENAHPHLSNNGSFVLVHNGIIENYKELQEELLDHGYIFHSSTDTEIFVNYIDYLYKEYGDVKKALIKALSVARGAFAIALMSVHEPNNIYALRRAAPLILGIGENDSKEYFLASDICAFLHQSRNVIFLDEDELVILSDKGYSIEDIHTNTLLNKKIERITWDIQSAQKQGYDHYMLKEIYEQADVIEQSLLGRIDKHGIHIQELAPMQKPKRIHIIACGTSYYAGLWGKYVIEEIAHIPVEVEIASEFRYRAKALEKDTLVIAITQSGETADTVAGISIAKELGCSTIAICNVVGSTITRIVDTVLHTQAGPEISVASTKAMTSQMLLLFSIAFHFTHNTSYATSAEYEEYIKELHSLPALLKESLPAIQLMAKEYAGLCKNKHSFFYLGRGLCYPLALEGALKLKELTYIHAEGYPAGEMKHGPIALVEPSLMTIVLLFDDEFAKKTQSAISEIQARAGQVIAICPLGTPTTADFEWSIPKAKGALQTFIMLPALQLFSYHVACLLERNVDMPRNLAKSVTVE